MGREGVAIVGGVPLPRYVCRCDYGGVYHKYHWDPNYILIIVGCTIRILMVLMVHPTIITSAHISR